MLIGLITKMMFYNCTDHSSRQVCLHVIGVVDQVVDIMRVNVDKVLERDQKISELDDRAGKKTA